jgi:hypothetical protein
MSKIFPAVMWAAYVSSSAGGIFQVKARLDFGLQLTPEQFLDMPSQAK